MNIGGVVTLVFPWQVYDDTKGCHMAIYILFVTFAAEVHAVREAGERGTQEFFGIYGGIW